MAAVALVLGALLSLAAGAIRGAAQTDQPHVLLATLHGDIDPITDAYIGRAVDQAVRDGAQALVISLDTPGGLDTSMRSIIQHILSARVPVVVYVSPSGARAASAGMYITEAADVAAMAPGTNIGSAHPVSIGGANPLPEASPSPGASTDVESQKIENDAAAYGRALATLHGRNADWVEQAVRQSVNVPVDTAVRLRVVDLESESLDTLLRDLDGRQVVKSGHAYTLRTAGAVVDRTDLSGFDSLLQAVADPTVAYLLLLLAIICIGLWVAHPGLFLPGVVGVVAGILAFMAFANLPVNLAGVLLIVASLVLFVVDIKATTHGVLTAGGVIAMGLGGLLLIDTGFLDEGVNKLVIAGAALLLGGSFGIVVGKIVRARRRPFAAGSEGLSGRVGEVREPLQPEGMVFADGALWRARTAGAAALERGTAVRVIRMEGLTLIVEPVTAAGTPSAEDEARQGGRSPRRWSLKRRASWPSH